MSSASAGPRPSKMASDWNLIMNAARKLPTMLEAMAFGASSHKPLSHASTQRQQARRPPSHTGQWGVGGGGCNSGSCPGWSMGYGDDGRVMPPIVASPPSQRLLYLKSTIRLRSARGPPLDYLLCWSVNLDRIHLVQHSRFALGTPFGANHDFTSAAGGWVHLERPTAPLPGHAVTATTHSA